MINTSGWSYNTFGISKPSLPVAAESMQASVSCTTQSYLYLTKGNAPFPYRTNAFFGFCSPNNVPIVTHFHIPIVPSTYLRRSRSTSLSNVFGTERYLYMSNDSLKRTIKRKLNFEHMHLPGIQRYYHDLEIDFEYLVDIDSNNNNNFERISEVCDARLRDVLHRNLRVGSSFLEKLGRIQYSRPLSPESVFTSTGNDAHLL